VRARQQPCGDSAEATYFICAAPPARIDKNAVCVPCPRLGTWSVLCHVFPKANIPVLQLSIDETQPALFHYELGKRLSSLRDRGVLIVGSGNLVHNLHAYGWGRREIKPFDWAMRFEQRVRELLSAGDHDPLIAYDTLGRDAALSVPTPDHYLPLLYVIAQQRESDEVSFPVEGFDGGSVSMLSVKIG
jgi:4,5-DOPA dioxygenase extradiol